MYRSKLYGHGRWFVWKMFNYLGVFCQSEWTVLETFWYYEVHVDECMYYVVPAELLFAISVRLWQIFNCIRGILWLIVYNKKYIQCKYFVQNSTAYQTYIELKHGTIFLTICENIMQTIWVKQTLDMLLMIYYKSNLNAVSD